MHHGNATENQFIDDDSVLYISLHRHGGGFYPGTGAHSIVGTGQGTGFNVNIPWSTGDMGDADYLLAFHHLVMPIATHFSPDLVIVSAGFDSARGDPLGGCDITPVGYAHMTAMLRSLANGRIAVCLEGATICVPFQSQSRLAPASSSATLPCPELELPHLERLTKSWLPACRYSQRIGAA